MGNLSLSQLLNAQKANPPLVDETGRILRSGASLPAAPRPLLAAAGETGYCRIFPPTYPTLVQVPESFKAEFWSVPSPWCRIDGLPDHPDFEDNLRKSTHAVSA